MDESWIDSLFSLEDPEASSTSHASRGDSVADALGSLCLPDDRDLAPSADTGEDAGAATGPSVTKRGRRHGSTVPEMVRRQILEGPQPEDLSLSEKRRRAALAKWQKRKDAVTDPGATDTVADSGCRELVAVPAADARESRLVPYVHGYEPSSMSCTGQLERHLDLWNSVPNAKNSSLERFLVETATQTYVPKSFVAARHGKSGQTVRRRLRILAFVVVIARRFRSNRWLEELYSHLVDSFGVQTVVPLSWCVKYKCDELSLRVASKETSGSATDESKITKLLQVTCWWLAVFKLNLDSGVKYVRTQLRSPTTLRAIEKSSGSCTKRALERQVLIPRSVPNLFADRTRMPIADQHVANEAADLALWAADAGTSLDKYTCRAHVQHRIGELIGATQPSEARGILYISLSLNFSGKVALFKANLKSYITAKLKIYEYGYEGSGQAATEHREHVFRQYLVTEDARERCTGTRGEARLKKYHTTKRLWNGRYKNTQVIEHFCLGLGRCCNNRGQTLAHFHDWVDRYDLPALFCRSRWLGIEQAVDACGFLLMAHDVFSPVFRQTFAESQKPTANPPLALLDRDGDNDGDKEEIDNEDDGEVLIDGELNLPQPEKDSTQDVRQATYRANGMTFVNDCPHGRVWMFRSAIRLQQNSQKSLIRNSGKTFQRAELLRRAKGKSPCYIPLMACEGFFTNTSMIDFCATVMEAKHHSAIPAEYRTHELAVASCRMGLAGSAATYQLMLRPAGDNFGFKLLKRGTVAQRLCAIELVERYLHRPCTLKPFWYDHVKLHKADVDSLCGEDSLQKLEAHADFVEIENVSTEALNSTIRRFVARCVQQNILNLEDLNAQWALQQEKSDITGVWGIDKSVVLDPMGKDTKRTAKPQTGGGGGRCRAFVSRLSQMPEYKHSNGRVCFAKIMQKWKDEQENPTELSHGLDEQGKLATRARRQQVHKDAEQSKWDISAFGRLRPQTTEVATKKLEIDVKIDALESAAQQHVGDSQQLLALVAVHTNIHKSLLEAHDTGDLGQQLRAIHQLCRALAIRESRRDRLEEKEARAKLQEAELCEGVDLSKFRDEKKGSGVSVFKGTECVEVRPVLNVFKWSTERVAEINEKKQGFGPMAEKLWQEEHVLERDTGEKLDPLPKGFATPYCLSHGYGRCLCSGPGEILRLAKANLLKALVRLFPKDSQQRGWIRRGFIVLELVQDLKLWHVSLLYLKPRRLTLTRMVKTEETYFGRPTFRPEKNANGHFHHAIDFEALELSCDLTKSCSFALFKLLTFKDKFDGWYPARHLPIEALHHHVPALGGKDEFPFWKGAAEEIEEERERVRKSAEAERQKAEKALRQAAGLEPAPKPPKRPRQQRKPRSKPTAAPRSVQKPAAAPQVLALTDLSDQFENAAEVPTEQSGIETAVAEEEESNNDVEDQDREWGAMFPEAGGELERSEHNERPDEALDCFLSGSSCDEAPEVPPEKAVKTPAPPSPGASVAVSAKADDFDEDVGDGIFADDEGDGAEAAPKKLYGNSEDSSSSDAPKPVRKKQVKPCAEDATEDAPFGCKLRRYVYPDRREWVGYLVPGRVDD